MSKIPSLAVCLLLMVPCALATTSKPTCAVLTFDVKGGVSKDEASLLSERFTAEFDDCDQYTLLPRAKMNEVLKLQEFARSDNCSATECAIEAGKLLSVQYMVYGSVGRIGSMFTVTSFMINVETGASVKRAITDHGGSIESLLTVAMRRNARQLLGLDERTESVEVGSGPSSVRNNVRTVARAETEADEGPPRPARVLPTEMRKGLALYYAFDKDEGELVNDCSSGGHNGQVRGATWTSHGKLGGAFRFDGRSYIDAGVYPAGSRVTVSLWFDGGPVGETGWLVGAHPSRQSIWFLACNADMVCFGYATRPGREHVVYYPVSVNRSGWQHVVGVATETNSVLYLDGRLVRESDKGANWGGSPINIGRSPNIGGECYFRGRIDEVLVYSRALSGDEVRQLHEFQK